MYRIDITAAGSGIARPWCAQYMHMATWEGGGSPPAPDACTHISNLPHVMANALPCHWQCRSLVNIGESVDSGAGSAMCRSLSEARRTRRPCPRTPVLARRSVSVHDCAITQKYAERNSPRRAAVHFAPASPEARRRERPRREARREDVGAWIVHGAGARAFERCERLDSPCLRRRRPTDEVASRSAGSAENKAAGIPRGCSA